MKIGGKIGGGGGVTKDFAPEYENTCQNTLCCKKRITVTLKIKPLGADFRDFLGILMKIGGKIGGGGGGGGGTKDFAPEYENIGQNTLCSKKESLYLKK